jgi:hypothetical protein
VVVAVTVRLAEEVQAEVVQIALKLDQREQQIPVVEVVVRAALTQQHLLRAVAVLEDLLICI